MAVWDDMFKGAGLPGLAVGIGAAVLVPVVAPAVGRMLRPVAKTVIRTGITVWREATGQIAAATGPLVAEARSEMDAARHS